eukprot:1161325-Pelagomonas_calceolata.AAC.25
MVTEGAPEGTKAFGKGTQAFRHKRIGAHALPDASQNTTACLTDCGHTCHGVGRHPRRHPGPEPGP